MAIYSCGECGYGELYHHVDVNIESIVTFCISCGWESFAGKNVSDPELWDYLYERRLESIAEPVEFFYNSTIPPAIGEEE